MRRILLVFFTFCLVSVAWLTTGCGGGVDVSNNIDIDSPPTVNGKTVQAQIEYWQDGQPLPDKTSIKFITTENRNPPPVYIIQGRQFRIVAQTIDGSQTIEIDPVTKISKFTWGAFPGPVVNWFDTSKGWFYHLDAQYPENVYCATGKIANCPVNFYFIVVCLDQLPD